ncbi:MAG: hypothetical protein Q8O92_04400 [Candidatus Latescibacter sp.]|nr:hypothetical protein [Candidatus Latescibacter sp.]
MKCFIRMLFMTGLLGFLIVSPAWSQKSGFGLGIIAGEPTGIDGKYWLSGSTAIDAGAAWSFVDHPHFQVQGDFVFHNFSVLKRTFEVTKGELPLYYGIGARLRIQHENQFGLRFVGGVSYIFDNAPVDIFLEVAPIMNLIPSTELDLSAAAGIRYWFK